MPNEEAGSVVLVLTADNSGLVTALKDSEVHTKESMSCISKDAEKAGEAISNAFKDAFQQAKKTQYNSLQEMSASTGKNVNQIRSEAMKMASEFKKQGLTQSEALKKAYSEMGLHAKKAEEKIRSESDKTKDKVIKNTNGLVENYSNGFKKVGAAIAKAFTVAAVIKFGKDSVESAAKVQASNAQLAQTFGDLQAKAEAAMQAVADKSGVLKTRLQGVGTDIFAFARTSGMDSAAAGNGVNALKFMQAYAEAEAGFLVCTADGSLKVKSLSELIPDSMKTRKRSVDETIRYYRELHFEEYVVQPISYTQFKYLNNKTYLYGYSKAYSWYTSDNILFRMCSNISHFVRAYWDANSGNYLFYNLLTFRPYNADVFARWWLEPGDRIKLVTGDSQVQEVDSFVLSRKIKGINGMHVIIEAKANEYLGNKEVEINE